jgi:hypothetical protein
MKFQIGDYIVFKDIPFKEGKIISISPEAKIYLIKYGRLIFCFKCLIELFFKKKWFKENELELL